MVGYASALNGRGREWQAFADSLEEDLVSCAYLELTVIDPLRTVASDCYWGTKALQGEVRLEQNIPQH